MKRNALKMFVACCAMVTAFCTVSARNAEAQNAAQQDDPSNWSIDFQNQGIWIRAQRANNPPPTGPLVTSVVANNPATPGTPTPLGGGGPYPLTHEGTGVHATGSTYFYWRTWPKGQKSIHFGFEKQPGVFTYGQLMVARFKPAMQNIRAIFIQPKYLWFKQTGAKPAVQDWRLDNNGSTANPGYPVQGDIGGSAVNGHVMVDDPGPTDTSNFGHYKFDFDTWIFVVGQSPGANLPPKRWLPGRFNWNFNVRFYLTAGTVKTADLSDGQSVQWHPSGNDAATTRYENLTQPMDGAPPPGPDVDSQGVPVYWPN